MIDKDTFALWIGVLGDRYGRELKAPTIRALYELLSPELDTDAFVAGVRRCLKREPFFPTPQQVIDAARPEAAAVDLAALRALDQLRTSAVRAPAGGRVLAPIADPAVREAVRLVGGADRVLASDPIEAGRVQRDFVAAYTAIARERAGREEIALLGAGTALAQPPRRRIAGDLTPIAELVDASAGSG